MAQRLIRQMFQDGIKSIIYREKAGNHSQFK